MEFLKHLKNKYPKDIMVQISNTIYFNYDIELSIQGSYCHYCIPRENLDYEKYTSMEFALFDHKKDKLIQVSDVLNILPEEDVWSDYYDGSIYGYVPVELIEKLYQELKRRYGLLEAL